MSIEDNLKIYKYYTDCKQIITHYGIEQQKLQFIQELSELIQALTKNDPENFAEELADVQVMIDQFVINDPELDKKVQAIQLEKVERQLNRIGEETCKTKL